MQVEVWYTIAAIIIGFAVWAISRKSVRDVLPDAAKIVFACGCFFTLWILAKKVLRLG